MSSNRTGMSQMASIDAEYNISHDTSIESMTGVSMTDGINATSGVHFGQQEQQQVLRSPSGDVDNDKPKKR